METSISNEARSTAEALIVLDLQLRRHHYHSPDEDAEPLDLVEIGAITNLEWDEKDGLWAQLDDQITFDITPTGSSICIYLDEEPVATLWAMPDGAETHWAVDWDADLTSSEQQHFLRKVGLLGKESAERVIAAVNGLRADSTTEDREAVAATVREWLSSR